MRVVLRASRPVLGTVASLLWAAAVAGAACNSDDHRNRDDGGAGTDMGGGGMVSMVIGSSGGTVTHPDGVTIEIPAGALPADTSITVAPSSNSPSSAVGAAYDFGPEGTQFARPVTVTLPFSADRIPAGKGPGDVVVLTAPQGSTDFVSVGGTVINSNQVQATTTHFSVCVPAVGTPDGGPPSDGGPQDGGGGGCTEGMACLQGGQPTGCCVSGVCITEFSACSSTTVCQAGACVACGGAGQTCCAFNSCDAGGCCLEVDNNAPPTSTCVAAGGSCAPWATGSCMNSQCADGTCGDLNGACCPPAQPPGSLQCTVAFAQCNNGTCGSCGDSGAACCAGGVCKTTACDSGTCR
jgi:hypothetical protein